MTAFADGQPSAKKVSPEAAKLAMLFKAGSSKGDKDAMLPYGAPIKDGANRFVITVTAADGAVRTYALDVKRGTR